MRGAAAEDASENVTMREAVAVFVAPDRRALSIEYDYNFPGRDMVRINDIGTVPAKGSFKYITENSSLVFSDANDARPLLTVRLRETAEVAAKPPLDKIPDEEKFSPAGREFRWGSKTSPQLALNTILTKRVEYRPSEVDGVTQFITTFAPITASDGNNQLIGQVAMLLSFPHDKDATGFMIRVRTLVQEGRKKSDKFENTSNPAILKAANDFVDKAMAELLGTQR
jgi:hypothetical protein